MKANSGSNCAQVFGAIGQQKHKVRTAPLGRISLNYKSKGSFCTKFSRKKNTFWSLDIFHPEGEKSCFIHNVFPSWDPGQPPQLWSGWFIFRISGDLTPFFFIFLDIFAAMCLIWLREPHSSLETTGEEKWEDRKLRFMTPSRWGHFRIRHSHTLPVGEAMLDSMPPSILVWLWEHVQTNHASTVEICPLSLQWEFWSQPSDFSCFDCGFHWLRLMCLCSDKQLFSSHSVPSRCKNLSTLLNVQLTRILQMGNVCISFFWKIWTRDGCRMKDWVWRRHSF